MIDPSRFQFGTEFDAKEVIKMARVTPDEEIQNAETLLWFKEKDKMVTICTRGNISAIIGKAKSRKTFFNTILAVSMITGSLFSKFIASQKKKLKVVYFDTEQGRGRAQRVVRRIVNMAASGEQIDMISLRPYSTSERVEIIEEYFNTHKPDFAFIDGIRDLIRDFNNLDQSTELMTSLLRWSEAHDCHICCVLHMNKADGNARGHLGSELMNKAESVLMVEMSEDGNYSEVKPGYMRDGLFEPFQFTIVNGLPVLCGFENETKTMNNYNPNERIESNRYFEKEDLPF
jgi:hypothetical protein